jgi:hypothetical protein
VKGKHARMGQCSGMPPEAERHRHAFYDAGVRMIRLPLVSVALLAVLVAGCGGSHPVKGSSVVVSVSNGPPETSASSRYSVAQVEQVFGAHGIALHRQQRRRGVVTLVGRNGVRVLVLVAGPGYAVGWTGQKPITRQNLTVFAGDAAQNAVSGALHDLN